MVERVGGKVEVVVAAVILVVVAGLFVTHREPSVSGASVSGASVSGASESSSVGEPR